VSEAPKAAQRPLRIGEVAELTGTTARTIRYYEEIGLLPGAEGRGQGKHRVYSDADVERLREIVRLRDLLGLSLDQLKQLLEAEEARAGLRREWEHTHDADERRRILTEALGHIDAQLELVEDRQRELDRLRDELHAKRQRVRTRLRNLPD
jgi:MerR family transcriptional regulator, repressor of the yfmOP operon